MFLLAAGLVLQDERKIREKLRKRAGGVPGEIASPRFGSAEYYAVTEGTAGDALDEDTRNDAEFRRLLLTMICRLCLQGDKRTTSSLAQYRSAGLSTIKMIIANCLAPVGPSNHPRRVLASRNACFPLRLAPPAPLCLSARGSLCFAWPPWQACCTTCSWRKCCCPLCAESSKCAAAPSACQHAPSRAATIAAWTSTTPSTSYV